MTETERMPFDFSGGDIEEMSGRLESILCSRHWSGNGLSYENEWTALLLRLLTIGGIAVYKRQYESRLNASSEVGERAGLFKLLINKRDMSQILLDIAGIFCKYDFDGQKAMHNTLFFPGIKSYVRYGGLSPERLFELLSQETCDTVIIFQDSYQGEDTAFYAFSRLMPKELLMEELAQVRERRLSALHEAMQATQKDTECIFPRFPIRMRERIRVSKST